MFGLTAELLRSEESLVFYRDSFCVRMTYVSRWPLATCEKYIETIRVFVAKIQLTMNRGNRSE